MPRMTLLLVSIATLCFACADAGSDHAGGDLDSDPICEGRDKGTWRVQSLEMSGTCGPMDDVLIVAPVDTNDLPDMCVGEVVISDNLCTVHQDHTCPEGRFVATTNWGYSGQTAKGKVVFTSTEDPPCKSTYTTTWKKID